MRAWLWVALVAVPASAQDVVDIVRRSVERDALNFERFRDYTFEETTAQTRYDKQGRVTSTDRQTFEVLMLAGQPYSRLIARDGKPLPAREAQKELEKVDKELRSRLKNPARTRQRYAQERAEGRRFFREIPDAFNFTLLGEETLDGLPVWKIRAEPRPGYRPRERRAGVFQKLRATIWIDHAGYQWVKAEVQVIEAISWGFFVLRIPPGATIAFSQMRVNDEVWLPKEARIRADARLGLLKTFRVGLDIAYRNYRKFQSESQVVGVEEIRQ